MNERVQQSKLASLGRLSASIAHEIRNPVGAMSHAAQLLAEGDNISESDARLTEIIKTHSSRVSHIIDNMLQLSRRENSRPERLILKNLAGRICGRILAHARTAGRRIQHRRN